MPDNNIVTKDLGPVSAWAIAKANGFDGTEAEWEALQANAAQNGSDAEAFAKGTRNGEAVASDDPAYHNNCAYHHAGTSADADTCTTKAAEATAAAATASAAYNVNLLAPNYSAESTYAVGDHVIYNGGYYECISAISTAEAWTAAHWRQLTVGGESADLKSALSNSVKSIGELCEQVPDVTFVPDWEQGNINFTTGEETENTNRLRSGFFSIDGSSFVVSAKSDSHYYRFMVVCYNQINGTPATTVGWVEATSRSINNSYPYYRLVMYGAANTVTNVEEGINVEITAKNPILGLNTKIDNSIATLNTKLDSVDDDLLNTIDERIDFHTNDVLADYDGWKVGWYYSSTYNEFRQLAARTCTDFIKCEQQSKWYCAYLFILQFFDANKNYLSENASVGGTTPTLVTFPENAEYVIVTYLTENASLWKFYPQEIAEYCDSPLLKLRQENYKNTLVENPGVFKHFVIGSGGQNYIYGNTDVSYHVKYSKKSKRIQLIRANQTSVIQIRLDNAKMSDGIGIWFWVDDLLRYGESATTCAVRYSNTSDYNNGCYRYAYTLKNGWNFVHAVPALCTTEGNTVSDDIRYMFLFFPQISTTVQGGEVTAEVFIDSIINGFRLKPSIAIVYDGMWAQTYENGIYQWHRSYNVPCNIGFTDFDDETNYAPFHPDQNVTGRELKDEALKLARIYGFEMGTYGGYGNRAGDVRAGTDIDTVANLIHGNQNALSNETRRPSTFYVCSQGYVSGVIECALKQCGIKVARTTAVEYISALDKDNIFVGAQHMYASDTAASVKAWIDTLIANGYCGVIWTHAVTTDPVDYQAPYEEWKEMLEYIYNKVSSGDLQVMNITEMVDRIRDDF